MLFSKKTLSRDFIEKNKLNSDKPDSNSFFFRAFNANLEIANEALKTQFIQGVKHGNLPPDKYGAYIILDAYYCYNDIDVIQAAINRTINDQELLNLLTKVRDGYTNYCTTFRDNWHIINTVGIQPTESISDYVKNDYDVAMNYHPLYTLVTVLPCYYLWYWISDNIINYANNNLYGDWIIDAHKPDTAYVIGNFVEKHPSFDDSLAMDVYSLSMKYEFINFKEAWQ